MRETTQNNAVDFILDGDAYFARLHEALTRLEQQGKTSDPKKPSYLRLAYWQADGTTGLPAIQNVQGLNDQTARSLNDAIAAIAAKKIPVSIIVWAGEPTGALVKEARANWALWRKFRTTANVEVYRESYGGYLWNPAISQHQKIALFCCNGISWALVGGLNLQDHYKSSATHDAKTDSDGHAINRWHDTAVHLTGPVVNTIEREWLRRWNKDENSRCEKHPKQDRQAPVQPTKPGVAITIATTNAEGSAPETDIRDLLIEEIGKAKSYVYLENYALSDPAVIAALSAKLAEGKVPVIVLASHPEIGFEQDFTAFSYLMYFTWLTLSLSNFNAFQARGRLGTYRVRYQDITRCGFEPLIYSLSYVSSYYWTWRSEAVERIAKYDIERADVLADALRRNNAQRIVGAVQTRTFEYAVPGLIWGENAYKLRLGDIVSVDAPACMYAPLVDGQNGTWPYVHSKLALIDDAAAFVGTSNWTFRSMQYDGEIAAILRDQATVRSIRTALFKHWKQAPDPAKWRSEAEANLERANRQALQAGRPYVVPLRLGNFHWWTPGAWASWLAPSYF